MTNLLVLMSCTAGTACTPTLLALECRLGLLEMIELPAAFRLRLLRLPVLVRVPRDYLCLPIVPSFDFWGFWVDTEQKAKLIH